ncbi:MAG: murein transglycosylase domain-containing protein [Bacteroidota bacterium]|nr:murein transglycosylase domain-containing protein [Bacteroidota bacterium]
MIFKKGEVMNKNSRQFGKLLLRTVVVTALVFSFGLTQDDFEAWAEKDQTALSEYSKAQEKAFDDFMKADREAFNQFKKEIEAKWDKFVESDRNTWVEYSSDKNTRTAVDFEKGEAKVEVLVSPKEAENQKLVEEKVTQAVSKLVTDRGTSKDYSSPVEKPKPLTKKPVLENQVKTRSGKKVTASNAKSFAKEVIKKSPPKKKRVKGKDRKTRVKVMVSFPLAPDHFQTRTKEVSSDVSKYARKYDVPNELVYAVIHTESAFNPKAKSHIPAFGLMQIVPKFAGRDAYNYIYKKDGIPKPNFLYNRTNNIMMGVAYLHILETRYWSKVKDPRSRQICVIASYNTGAGNVAKVFTGTTSPRKALPKINRMNYDRVYNSLKRKLPYKETRDYIERVTRRIPMYKN